MDEQGRSTFSEDQNGRILDRLAGLEKVISQEQITNALKATNKQSVRRCKLTKEIMILVVLAMGLFTELSIRQRSSKPAERFAKARLRPADPHCVSLDSDSAANPLSRSMNRSSNRWPQNKRPVRSTKA